MTIRAAGSDVTGVTAVPKPQVARDPLDFDEVYDRNVDFVWRSLAALGVAQDRLEDAVQDVFLVVHAKLAEFEGRSKLSTWLYGIARNVALEHIRAVARQRRRDRGGLDVPVDSEAPADDQLDLAVARRLLPEALARIPPDRREVFVLVELEEISVKEVAAMLQLNENTVWSRLRVARREFEKAVARVRARLGEMS
jgi:RNA polymerase sigma-70 factor (ECF subfamily)